MLPDTHRQEIDRRHFNRLSLAALGGMVAGTTIACRPAGEPEAEPATGNGDADQPANGDTGATTDGSASKTENGGEQLPEGVDPQLLTQEPHVCRGLNTCKGNGKGGENACAGQGACATAEPHACAGLNACKGQGGCGQYPGQNTCQEKGECAVPIEKQDVWQRARDKFVQLMEAKGKEVGQPPA